MTITILKRKPEPSFGRPYNQSGSFNGYYESGLYLTQEAAWQAAQQWARDYRASDTLGNFADALGIVEDQGHWRGVINYYHSDT